MPGTGRPWMRLRCQTGPCYNHTSTRAWAGLQGLRKAGKVLLMANAEVHSLQVYNQVEVVFPREALLSGCFPCHTLWASHCYACKGTEHCCLCYL